jgi:Ca2+-binding EF-hand superfamily protein
LRFIKNIYHRYSLSIRSLSEIFSYANVGIIFLFLVFGRMGQTNRKPNRRQSVIDQLEFEKRSMDIVIDRWFNDQRQSFGLDRSAFIDKCLSMRGSHRSITYFGYLFRAFDLDNDGLIDLDELIIAMKVSRLGSKAQQMEWLFRMFDIDGSGGIEHWEMLKIIESIYADDQLAENVFGIGWMSESADERTTRIFADFDRNRIGSISRRQFVDSTVSCHDDDVSIFRFMFDEIRFDC